ncbi:MAG: hypothetical protein ACE5KM_05745 [Planctomycetaceae bacterium]
MDGIAARQICGKTKSGILAEGIAATGGPGSHASASVRNYIEQHFPGFPWGESWHAEIEGAKAALRLREGKAEPGPAAGTAMSDVAPFEAMARAREFIAEIGGGDVGRATGALAFLRGFGSLEGMNEAVELWSRLLQAVDGNDDTAGRILDVFMQATNREPFLRVFESQRPGTAA